MESALDGRNEKPDNNSKGKCRIFPRLWRVRTRPTRLLSQPHRNPTLSILSSERDQFAVILGGELISYQTFPESYGNFVLVRIEVLI